MKLRITTKRYFQSIAEFSFIKEIGVGSFGFVKLALHILTNKCYAVKIVELGLFRSTSDRELARMKSCSLRGKLICILPLITRTSLSYGTRL